MDAEKTAREIATAIKARQVEDGFDPPPIRTFEVVLPFIQQLTADLTTANQRIAELEGENTKARAELDSLQDDAMPSDLVGGINYLIDHSNKGWTRVGEYHKTIDSLTTQLTAANEKCERLEKANTELRHFVHDVCLHMQMFRSTTDDQKTEMFQRSYRLYMKHNCEEFEKP